MKGKQQVSSDETILESPPISHNQGSALHLGSEDINHTVYIDTTKKAITVEETISYFTPLGVGQSTHTEGGISKNIQGYSNTLPTHKSVDVHPIIVPLDNTNSSEKTNEEERKSGPQTVQTKEQNK
jgi:hypothetical protein